eukprot:247926-Prymnesium_polylepis.1
MRLDRLQTVRVVGQQRGEEHAARQPRDAHVLVDAHGVLVALQREEPPHRHEVALRAQGRTSNECLMFVRRTAHSVHTLAPLGCFRRAAVTDHMQEGERRTMCRYPMG